MTTFGNCALSLRAQIVWMQTYQINQATVHNLDLKWQNFFEQIMLHFKSLYVYSYMPNIKQKA